MEGARKGFRSLFLVVLWLNFVALWFWVYENTTIRDVADSITYLVDLGLAYCAFVTLWVYHNIRIYRKKGPRLRARPVTFSGDQDQLNRHIRLPVNLDREQHIVVDIVQNEKIFSRADAPRSEPVEEHATV